MTLCCVDKDIAGIDSLLDVSAQPLLDRLFLIGMSTELQSHLRAHPWFWSVADDIQCGLQHAMANNKTRWAPN